MDSACTAHYGVTKEMQLQFHKTQDFQKHKGRHLNEVAADNLTRRRGKNNVDDLLSSLKSCSRKRDLQAGRRIHSNAIETGKDSNIYVAAALIDMYAKCGSMSDAQPVFNKIQKPDVVSWTALILGYADNGHGHHALGLFSRMKAVSKPNSVTYIAALKACRSLADEDEVGKRECLVRGREIHSAIGQHMTLFLQSTLIDMYSKCGSMIDARRVFDSIEEPNVVSWTTLILGYADNGEGQAALSVFSRMKALCAPNSVTYIAALKACTSLAAEGDEAAKAMYLEQGIDIHSEIGHHMGHFVQSTLINMYAKCKSMVDAKRVFDSIKEPDVVSWTAVIMGYADNGDGQAALELFSRMQIVSKCIPDSMSYIAALKACGSIGALAIGRNFHSKIPDFNVHVVTCLTDFYAKCGSMVEARDVFNSHMRARDITTWNALITGYGRFGDIASVFNLFQAMQDQGFQPDAITFVCMLSCCSHAGLVEKAREYLEAMTVQYGVTPHVIHYNSMIDILGRANKLEEAVCLIQKMSCSPNTVTWMTLLGVCRKWKNVDIGRLAFRCLVDLDAKNATAHVLMAQIYGSMGMREEQEMMLLITRKFGACKVPGEVYVMDGFGRTVKFAVGEEYPPEVENKLNQFHGGMHVALSQRDGEKEEALCGHTTRRAVVYGILKTPPSEPIRAFKNMRMCDDCHWATKIISKLSQRVIIVRDERCFHVMENGTCSCEVHFPLH